MILTKERFKVIKNRRGSQKTESCPLPPKGGSTSGKQKVPFRGFRGNLKKGLLRQLKLKMIISFLKNLSFEHRKMYGYSSR
jgi:hypothetical protein